MKKERWVQLFTKKNSILALVLLITSCSSTATNKDYRNQAEWRILAKDKATDGIKIMKMLDESTWWVSKGNELFQTVNAGEQWRLVTSVQSKKTLGLNMPTYLSDIQLIANSVGLILGDDLIKTEDGGKTWSDLDISASINREEIPVFRSFHFLNENQGWVVGEIIKNAGVQKAAAVWETSDAGKHWEKIVCLECDEQEVFWGVASTNKDSVWFLGNSIYYKRPSSKNFQKVIIDLNLLSSNLIDIGAIGSNIVWAEVENGTGYYVSYNGGETWEAIKLERPSEQIVLINRQQGFYISKGDIYVTEDGGKTWNISLRGKYYKLVIANNYKLIAAIGEQIAINHLK